jgi:hypothetical protein
MLPLPMRVEEQKGIVENGGKNTGDLLLRVKGQRIIAVVAGVDNYLRQLQWRASRHGTSLIGVLSRHILSP